MFISCPSGVIDVDIHLEAAYKYDNNFINKVFLNIRRFFPGILVMEKVW
jgi:hypothetical protein